MKIGEKRAIWKVLIALPFILVWLYGGRITKANPEDPGATLTGVIHDQGVDEDGDGTYDFLEIGVEVNVTRAAYYGVELKGLVSSNSIYMDIRPEIYLEPREVGINVILIRISGQWIYSFGLNPANVSSVSLRDRNNSPLEGIAQIPLSREYLYTEFDAPGATLTGVVFDQGVDEDGDGTYDFLEIGVQVNVTREAQYRIDVSGAQYPGYAWGLGVQVVNVSINGQMICVSRLNPANISYVSLFDENGNIIWRLEEAPLSREYLYTEFDQPGAVLTGKIFDKGVDVDEDGTFDYLEVGVEINVTQPGDYYIATWGLLANETESIEVGGYQYELNVSVGVHIASLHLDGPTIYSSRLNPVNVSNLEISGDYRAYNQLLRGIPLSRKYLYAEFDKPQVSVGDWAKYIMNSTWHSTDPNATEPDQIKEQRDVKWMKIDIQEVYGPQITMSQTYLYENGTETQLPPVSGDVNYQFLAFIIPSNLQKGDRISSGFMPFNPVDEAQGIYAGMRRNLTCANFTMSFFGINMTMKMYWDRFTGILCEMNTVTSMQVGSYVSTSSTSTKMTETNLWKIMTKLSCSVSQDTIKEGSSILVSGSIDADLLGRTVILTYAKPDGSILNRTMTTDSNGAYYDSYALEVTGSWNVSASWEGDLTHTGAVSSLKSIVVTPKPFFETSLGMATIGVVTFIVVMPVAFFLLRRRKG